jgi:hypothetical protein
MPSSSEFVVASCQATLFTPDEEVSSAKIIAGIVPRWASRFDGEPVVMPFPGPVPREVPRVILQDKTGSWRCEIASARINVFWRRTAPLIERGLSTSDFFAEAASLLVQYQDVQRTRVGRLAALVGRLAQQEAPGLYLARHFCRDRWLAAPLNRPGDFELHAHKRYEHSGFRVNSWFRNKTGALAPASPDGKIQGVILVEQDLNTFPEDEPQAAFSSDEVRRFCQMVIPEFDHILDLYYPKEA